MTPWTIIGLSAAALTTFSFVPQIIKVWKNKCAKDISLVTLFQFSLGVSLWVIYGIHLKDLIIIAANGITLITVLILICFYFYFERRKK